ncbi:hypothetical protein [Motilibacter aurantiacus]|uniref:hypothetical protein n=1 Tax=Motilibacter aurantiacus TaxID=2714955 RepID=UPI001408618B|nr:hypothetical protein [Motilibacter aurantiacus]NHC46243.1 hypothetical protein [Motilibacter aurantiacus]
MPAQRAARAPRRPEAPAAPTDDRAGPRRAWLVAALVAAALVAVLVAVPLSRGDDEPSVQERVAELSAAEAQREAAQVDELTLLAGDIAGQLTPVAQGLLAQRSTGPTPADQLEEWRQVAEQLAARFAAAPSGSSKANVARTALRTSVELYLSAVRAEQLARGDDRAGEGLDRLAADLAAQASRSWGVAATQIDLLNVEQGNGHVHLSLTEETSFDHG